MATSSSRDRLLKAMAYWAVVLIGIALAFAFIFRGGGQVGHILTTVANVLSYIVVGCYSFFYAKTKNIWWVIAWVAAVVLIVVFTILPFFFG